MHKRTQHHTSLSSAPAYNTSNSSTRFGAPSNWLGIPKVTFQNSNVCTTSPVPPFLPAKVRLYSGSTLPDTEMLRPGMSSREVMVGFLEKVERASVKTEEALPAG